MTWVWGRATVEREVEILRTRQPDVDAKLGLQLALAMADLRSLDLFKPPGVAETLDWAESLRLLEAGELSPAIIESTVDLPQPEWPISDTNSPRSIRRSTESTTVSGPFGVGNPTPVFVARGVRVKDAKPVGDGRHLRLTLADGGARLAAIAFRMAETHGGIAASGGAVDAAFQLQEDSWNGRTRLQARLVDLRPAE